MLKKISKADFESLCQGGKILEKEPQGPKVWLLPEKRILKTFRRKSLVSSQMWMPYAKRFARNAYLLQKRAIPTIEIISTFLIPEIERQGVLYKLLEGETLRDWIAENNKAKVLEKLELLGCFIGELHRKGILFRSLHLGNILVMDNGELGLIDISDMGFRWWGGLSVSQRIRNFHHMDRYDADRTALSGIGGQRFLDGYLSDKIVSVSDAETLRESFQSIFNQEGL